MNRSACRRFAVLSTVVILISAVGPEARAAFHLMRIDEVLAGAGGDPSIQFVELQMTSSFQDQVGGHQLQFFDAAGTLTGTFTIPRNVSGTASGSSILIGTQAFKAVSTVAPDFIMPPLIQAPGGRVCFKDSVVDPCVSYGSYTGSMVVSGFNYVAPAAALPVEGLQSLKRVRTASPFNNSTDFTLGTPAPRNNAGQSGVIDLGKIPPGCRITLAVGPTPPDCLQLPPGSGTCSAISVEGGALSGAGPFSFQWEVAPAAGATVLLPAEDHTDICFSQPGDYAVRLKVKTSGAESSCEIPICVLPRPSPPVCKLSLDGPRPPACLAAGGTVRADGSGSTGSLPLIFHYEVSPAAGVTIDSPNSAATVIRFGAGTLGGYTVRLTVINGAGDSSCEAAVCVEPAETTHRFKLGNCDGEGDFDITDAVALLSFLFTAGKTPGCLAACDADGEAGLTITDAIFVLSFLFQGGSDPAPPFPACDSRPAAQCGQDTCGG